MRGCVMMCVHAWLHVCPGPLQGSLALWLRVMSGWRWRAWPLSNSTRAFIGLFWELCHVMSPLCTCLKPAPSSQRLISLSPLCFFISNQPDPPPHLCIHLSLLSRHLLSLFLLSLLLLLLLLLLSTNTVRHACRQRWVRRHKCTMYSFCTSIFLN